jgi:hypothetical protein
VAVAINGLVVDFVKSVPVQLSDEALESSVPEIFRQNVLQLFFIKNL